MSITKKQKQVYDFIVQYWQEWGYAPTQLEIKDHFHLKSLGSVQDYLKYLKASGYLEHDANAVRGLIPIIPEDPAFFYDSPTSNSHSLSGNSSIQLPLLGKVAAGLPIEVVDQNEFVDIPANFVTSKSEHYVLQVDGDSMIEDGIFDQDYLIVKEQKNAQKGQTVIAVINNQATVKKLFYPGNQQVELRPANKEFQSQFYPASQVEIKGLVVGLLRQF